MSFWFQFYRASNFYSMAIAAEPSSPSSPPSAADWVAVSIALMTMITFKRTMATWTLMIPSRNETAAMVGGVAGSCGDRGVGIAAAVGECVAASIRERKSTIGS
jgi:hypothetical protein